ncbi:hypothetical protein PV379_03185 [Streptomyces caniscabiei]|uniref:hypothetical protein n=1 Tax=Streptomyces caniscabiei TaxID=2746961 RepID=UPI0029A4C054|nr:hypothetical protein [Streptomyces caniscabiei]MDX2776347.1 hypothetical protein [Streptomyces caniscabiei]
MINWISKRVAILAGLVALGIAAGLFIVWPGPEAPKTAALQPEVSTQTTTATIYIPLPLFRELKEGNYKNGSLVQRVSDGAVRSTQTWTNKRGYKVELAATGSTPMKLKSVTFPLRHDQRWTCSPEEPETISYVITYGEVLQKSVEDGTTKTYRDGPSQYVNGGTVDCAIL